MGMVLEWDGARMGMGIGTTAEDRVGTWYSTRIGARDGLEMGLGKRGDRDGARLENRVKAGHGTEHEAGDESEDRHGLNVGLYIGMIMRLGLGMGLRMGLGMKLDVSLRIGLGMGVRM